MSRPKSCRGCNGEDLFTALNLGQLPLANFLTNSLVVKATTYPLVLEICNDCLLGQVSVSVDPKDVFEDYRYLSSISTSFVKHAKNFAIEQSKYLRDSDWVLEIASNDGYLLNHFQQLGVKVLGVEPALNVARISNEKGIPTLNAFFGSKLAHDILKEKGYPALIVANNVLAHVPNIVDFAQGLSVLCGPDTRISVENPSILNILQNNQFDTIYHEHYSYLSVTFMEFLSKKVGLILADLELIPTHGGSNRYWLRVADENQKISATVHEISKKEMESGLGNFEVWQSLAKGVQDYLLGFKEWLVEANLRGEIVCGYGAAAKASTILNAAQISTDLIPMIADASPEKQQRFMPNVGIPIVNINTVIDANPDHLIIFPWNIAEEIQKELVGRFKSTTEIWTQLPTTINGLSVQKRGNVI